LAEPLLGHVDLAVTSLEHSLPFYKGLLELLGGTTENRVRGERGETIHYLSRPEGRGAVGLRERRSDAHGVPYDRYAVGIHHLALRARSRDDVDAVARWLGDVGAQLESEPREYDYTPGYYAVFFYDPDGIKLEVVHRE
jgi:catechol 2,3-dioxygenase-like lactoylglutathione lyase family enzyme